MNPEFKTVVAVLLVAIVASLGKALFHLSADADGSAGMVRALTVRIALSVALFLLLLIGWYCGAIEPHALR